MSYEVPGFKIGTLTASADNSGNQFRYAKVSGSGTATVTAAPADVVLGVIQNKPKAGEAVDVMVTGISKVVAGAAVAAGAEVGSDAQGRAIAAATGARAFGIALEAASAAGQLIAVSLPNQRVVP